VTGRVAKHPVPDLSESSLSCRTGGHGFAFASIWGGKLMVALGRPPRSQRKTAVASLGVELDHQDLVKLNDIHLEAQP
jgi:hypothetical protein